MSDTGQRTPRALFEVAVTWTVLFLGNLILPLLLAIELVHGRGWLGVVAGCTFCWLSGLCLMIMQTASKRTMLIGASLTGLSQLFPILQVLAGIIALTVWQPTAHMLGIDERLSANFIGPCFVTMSTGGILMTVAIFSGGGMSVMARAFTYRESPLRRPYRNPFE